MTRTVTVSLTEEQAQMAIDAMTQALSALNKAGFAKGTRVFDQTMNAKERVRLEFDRVMRTPIRAAS